MILVIPKPNNMKPTKLESQDILIVLAWFLGVLSALATIYI